MICARSLLACLFAVCGVFPAFAARTWKTDKSTGCRFEVPATWAGYAVQWTGTCATGAADGSGVLRAFRDGKLLESYYGKLKEGVLVIGVVESNEGYVAGRFSDGKPVKDDDRRTYILAFREAAGAANWASEFYRQRGNTASARYYLAKAKSLNQQMD
jgi:hypothetical protein